VVNTLASIEHGLVTELHMTDGAWETPWKEVLGEACKRAGVQVHRVSSFRPKEEVNVKSGVL